MSDNLILLEDEDGDLIPATTSAFECNRCSYEWIALHPVEYEGLILECPKCHSKSTHREHTKKYKRVCGTEDSYINTHYH